MPEGAASEPAGARLTSRQRRIQEQRQEISVVRRQRRRRLLVWFSVIVALLALAIALTVVLVRPPGPGVAAQPGQVAAEQAGYPYANPGHPPAVAPVGYLTAG